MHSMEMKPKRFPRNKPPRRTKVETEVDKLIKVDFIREVQYPIWLAMWCQSKEGQIRICNWLQGPEQRLS